ncbi:conserved Plasmodium protein, unknown function [Plasmodium gallinaceum]|uniref:Uncharacterized protein n=1 Tax=Plasmodium gallinaceum TaxID=5849 RepID=A0A1J1GXQ0_PLAGA|nr:conserved Plasmodium protein, unknown function [Plasmodium gallinaceum]CRG97016.1 conserved Plasmodium protein, unknown function [Plasmodium gallinaceum]
MNKSIYKLLEVGVLTGGFFFIWYLTSEKRLKKKKKIVKENILLILRHLCLEIYKILNDTSKTSRNVYDMLKNQPNASIELSKLEEVLLNNGYKKKIEDAEKEVLNKFNLTVEDFYEELKSYEKDDDIQKSINSIKKMYNESLLGLQPKLPSIDANISEDVIINLTSMIYKEKRKVYKSEINLMIKKNENLNVDTLANAEFFEKLQKSTEHVEEKVINENKNLIPNLFTFKYLVNYYSNDESFLQKKKYLESKHGEKMIKILKIKKNKKKKKTTKDSSNNSLRSTPSFTSLADNQNSDKSVTTNQINVNKLENEETLNKSNELKHNIEQKVSNLDKIENEKDVNEIENKKILNEEKYENEENNSENLIDMESNTVNNEGIHENTTDNESIIKNKKDENDNVFESESLYEKKENEDLDENKNINEKKEEVEKENITQKKDDKVKSESTIENKKDEDVAEIEIVKEKNEDIVENEYLMEKEDEDIIENESINEYKKNENSDKDENKIIKNVIYDINENYNSINKTKNDKILSEDDKNKNCIYDEEKEFGKNDYELENEQNKIKKNSEIQEDIEIENSLEHPCDKEELQENYMSSNKGKQKNENSNQNNLENKRDIPAKSHAKKKKWKKK